MPIPQPKSGEEQQVYISRCVGDTAMVRDYSDQKQRLAVCYSTWREHHGKTAAQDAIKAALSQPLSFDELLKRGLS